MSFIDFRENYSKGQLRWMLGMEETKFKTWLREVEPDLIKIEPRYNKYCKHLTFKAFKFLTSEYGLEPSETNKRIQDYYKMLGIKRYDSP